MRFAVLSDIHANLEALTKVLQKAYESEPDLIACVGDIVGYGPYPNECIDLIRQQCACVVLGNHDGGAVGRVPPKSFNTEGRIALEWTRDQLTTSNREFLQNLPASVVSYNATFVHASPRLPLDWEYVATLRTATEMFEHFSTAYCCIGHTHIPSILAADGTVNSIRDGQKHLINVGSVGQPRDGNPRASFALLDTETSAASIIRVEYDVSATATAIRQAGLPEFLAKRLQYGI